MEEVRLVMEEVHMREVLAVSLIATLFAISSKAGDDDGRASAQGVDERESVSAVDLASGDCRVRLGAVIQADGRFFLGDKRDLGADSFFLRRAEVALRGSVRKHVEFRIAPNLGMGKAALSDAYVDYRLSRAARLRVGRTKVPVSLEYLQSNRMHLLLEPSLPARLAPGRDQGVMLHGAPFNGRMAYALGVFNGAVDGSSADGDTDDGKELVARLLARPFATAKSAPGSGLALGLSVSTQERAGVMPAFKSAGQMSFFSYVKDAAADGRQNRVAPQGMFYSGPFGLQAEYVRSEQEVVCAETRARLAHQAWSALASVVLFGGAAGFDSVKVAHPFEPESGDWGALQIAVRIEGYDADGDAFALGLAEPHQSARRVRGLGLGLHWYLGPSLRCSMVFSRTRFDGGAESGDRPVENTVQVRSQVVF
ncbi:MAG: porin [Vicinamibacteria bacterium]|nr:porin [Vicinamibacteria bacterium]